MLSPLTRCCPIGIWSSFGFLRFMLFISEQYLGNANRESKGNLEDFCGCPWCFKATHKPFFMSVQSERISWCCDFPFSCSASLGLQHILCSSFERRFIFFWVLVYQCLYPCLIWRGELNHSNKPAASLLSKHIKFPLFSCLQPVGFVVWTFSWPCSTFQLPH